MSTRETIEQWVERFNAGDAEGIAALYAEDAVNHQAGPPSPTSTGRRSPVDR
jgi:ketosteroid isomerase-like protein